MNGDRTRRPRADAMTSDLAQEAGVAGRFGERVISAPFLPFSVGPGMAEGRHDRSFVCSCGGVRVPATMAGGGLSRPGQAGHGGDDPVDREGVGDRLLLCAGMGEAEAGDGLARAGPDGWTEAARSVGGPLHGCGSGFNRGPFTTDGLTAELAE